MANLISIAINQSIIELISPENINNLELLAEKVTNTALSISWNDILVNQVKNGVNLFYNAKQDIINIFFTTNCNIRLNPHISDIIQSWTSADFTYNRFMESSKRMIQHMLNSKISMSNVEITHGIRRGNSSFVYTNPNYFNKSYWAYLAYLAFMCYKAHLAYFIAFLFMIVRYWSPSKLALYLYLLILQATPVGGLNITLANKLISGIGWGFYINFMAFYDLFFKNIQSSHVSQTLFTNGRINLIFLRERLLLGALFAIVINTGVLFSSSFAFIVIPFLSLWGKIIAVVASFIISTLASTAWLYAARPELLGYGLRALILSYIRAFSESFAFNALSYANFIIWSLLPQTYITYITTFVVGLISYCGVSYFQVMLETNLNHRFIYGFIYNFVFTGLSLSSSGLYFLMNIIYMNLPLKIGLMSLCLMIVTLLPLEVYRFPLPIIRLGSRDNNNTLVGYLVGRDRANNPIVRHLVSILYQLIVFFAFAIGTFIWLDLSGLSG